MKIPKATSTGTTIVGCLFKDGIVLGADTRATAGEIVADKNCEKVAAHRFLAMTDEGYIFLRFTLSASLSGVVALVRRQILSLSPLLSRATSSCTHCQQAANHALSLP